jgi:hypothetical protein
MYCAIAGFLVFGHGMVDLRRVLLDLEIVPDQRRPQETIHVVVGIENEPRSGEVAPIVLKCLRIQLARLGEASTQAINLFCTALDGLGPGQICSSRQHPFQDEANGLSKLLVDREIRLLIFINVHGSCVWRLK